MNKKGTNLTELMITCSIIGLGIMALASSLNTIKNVQDIMNSRADAKIAASYFMKLLTHIGQYADNCDAINTSHLECDVQFTTGTPERVTFTVAGTTMTYQRGGKTM